MNKFNIGDKVILTHPNNIHDYIDDWKEFWYDNKNTIFSISSIIDDVDNDDVDIDDVDNDDVDNDDVDNDDVCYNLQYPNGKVVMNPIYSHIAIFAVDELVPYITTNPLPDDLFQI